MRGAGVARGGPVDRLLHRLHRLDAAAARLRAGGVRRWSSSTRRCSGRRSVVATAGATLGGAITWWMGYGAERAYEHMTHKHPDGRALRWLRRFGPKACLLSWLPIVGDPLCAVAGWLKLPFWPCLVYMTIGKFGALLRHDRGPDLGLPRPVRALTPGKREEDAAASSLTASARPTVRRPPCAWRASRRSSSSPSSRRRGAVFFAADLVRLGDLGAERVDARHQRLDVLRRRHAELLQRLGGALLEDRLELVPLLAGLGGDVVGHARHLARDLAELLFGDALRLLLQRAPSLTSASNTCLPSACALAKAPMPASQICCADSLTEPASALSNRPRAGGGSACRPSP